MREQHPALTNARSALAWLDRLRADINGPQSTTRLPGLYEGRDGAAVDRNGRVLSLWYCTVPYELETRR